MKPQNILGGMDNRITGKEKSGPAGSKADLKKKGLRHHYFRCFLGESKRSKADLKKKGLRRWRGFVKPIPECSKADLKKKGLRLVLLLVFFVFIVRKQT